MLLGDGQAALRSETGVELVGFSFRIVLRVCVAHTTDCHKWDPHKIGSVALKQGCTASNLARARCIVKAGMANSGALMGGLKATRKVTLEAAAFLCAMIFVLAGTAKAQGSVELFGGFSYLRGDLTYQQQTSGITVCGITCQQTIFSNVTQNPNLFGWEFSAGHKLVPFLSMNADFGEQYGSLNGGSVRVRTYLFGPQLSLPGPISLFVHAELGFARESVGTFTNPNLISPGSDRSFATVLGGGLDIKAVPFLSLRVIQIDDLMTRLYQGRQSEPRVSAGIVLHF